MLLKGRGLPGLDRLTLPRAQATGVSLSVLETSSLLSSLVAVGVAELEGVELWETLKIAIDRASLRPKS